ncbi:MULTISPECIES: heme-degrading domain-containing protein [unclassified Geodermatophilus]
MTGFPTVAELAAEEDELQLAGFTNDDAWELGSALVAAARRVDAPVAVEITRNGHRLFTAALTGATPDNADWIERKSRVVHRFGHSSLHVRQTWVERGTTFEESAGLDPRLYAAHGGAVPLLVRGVGPVGVVAVSGLPQLEDHRMVVAALRAHLGR